MLVLQEDLKDDSEIYRKMVMEAIDAIVGGLGAADIDSRLEEQLIDGIMYAFQEQTTDDNLVMLNGFGCVVRHPTSPLFPIYSGINFRPPARGRVPGGA